MGWWLGCPVQRSDSRTRQHYHRGVSPCRVQPRVPIHVFGVEVADHQDRHSSAETGGQVLSDQWAGRRELSRKDIHRSASQYNLDGSILQVGQARNRN
jgi:hypothetical protein